MNSPQWLLRARKLAALAQNGLMFTKDPFDRERYESIRTIAAEMLADETSATNAEAVSALLSNECGYATPKVDVRSVVFAGDKILLVKERSDRLWTLPGGYVDVGEAPSEAVVREVEEESGYQVVATKLLALYDKLKHDHPIELFHIYKLFFRCEIIGGAAADSLETEAAHFFPESSLPPLSCPRVTENQIHRMFEHFYQPDLPADFD